MVSGGVSGEYSTNSKTGGSKGDSSDDTAIEATGGDTLLSTNPAAWPESVMPYTNWRVTQYDDVVSESPLSLFVGSAFEVFLSLSLKSHSD